MDLIDLSGVHESVPDFYDGAAQACNTPQKPTKKQKTTEKVSAVKKLGQWVKNAVNCCIE